MSTSATFTRSPWSGNADADELQRWAGVARDVAAVLATDAVVRDKESRNPVDQVQLIRESGLGNLMVPTQFGGHGGHWETAFLVTRILARADASIAQILGYHYLNQACITFYGLDEELQVKWYTASTTNNWIWSDSFNPVSPDLSFTAEGENYRLSGLKRFATGAAVADVIIAGAIASGGDYDGQLVVFALPAGRAGIDHLGDWDHLGQRASASGSVRYTDVLIEPTDIIGIDRDEPFSSVVTPGVQLLFGNVYLGIAEGALAQARELTLARPNSWFLSGVERYSEDPLVHRLFGELISKTVAVEALADRLNRRYDDAAALAGKTTAADRAELEIAIAQLKVISTEVGLDVSSRVFEATGASATKSSLGLDIYWRNIRTHSLHDPVDYKKVEVGANYLTGVVQPVSLYT